MLYNAVERAVLLYSKMQHKSCCIVQYSADASSRAYCIAMQQYSQYTNAAIHHNTVYNTIHSPSDGDQRAGADQHGGGEQHVEVEDFEGTKAGKYPVSTPDGDTGVQRTVLISGVLRRHSSGMFNVAAGGSVYYNLHRRR